MRYVAAYMLAVLGGNEHPKASDIQSILDSVGVGIEKENLDFVLKSLEGKKLNDIIAEGTKKLSSLSMGSGSGAVAAIDPKAKKADESTQKEAAKPAKEEKKDEPESDDDMGFGLFD
ncbi:unnamed protein product [Gordionus sp. m RMFG-2023]|uniref:large ribosomal subunit protein P2-like n=1 Tax=Gordionus sp. m RMFG-2023 TaxID=3053472 RepID=UPI0030E19FB8